jgi:hypothetical protein
LQASSASNSLKLNPNSDWLAYGHAGDALSYGSFPSFKTSFLAGTTMPSADFCCTARVNESTLSPGSGTCNRAPAISLAACNAQPPASQPAPLMDVDFAVDCQLVRRRRPEIRFCPSARVFAPRFLQTSTRDDALALRYRFSSIRTCARELSIMHGVEWKGPSHELGPFCLIQSWRSTNPRRPERSALPTLRCSLSLGRQRAGSVGA